MKRRLWYCVLFRKRLNNNASGRQIYVGRRTTSGFAFPTPRRHRCVAVRRGDPSSFSGRTRSGRLQRSNPPTCTPNRKALEQVIQRKALSENWDMTELELD